MNNTEEPNWAEVWANVSRRNGRTIGDTMQVKMVHTSPRVFDLLLRPCKQAEKIHKMKWVL